jgi:hypothetical protein
MTAIRFAPRRHDRAAASDEFSITVPRGLPSTSEPAVQFRAIELLRPVAEKGDVRHRYAAVSPNTCAHLLEAR